ncbi:MAG: ABC transporter substrate-binding protein [Pseudomonadota bacterium]
MFQRRTHALKHPALPALQRQLSTAKLNRRSFLAQAGAIGITAPAALTLAGPSNAQTTPTIRPGGTLRIQQNVFAMKDPRTYDWSELGNMTRGFLEYLVQQNIDGSLQGMLLERWDTNENATEYTFHLRQNVTWSNGDAFTAAHVAHNFDRWGDSTVDGNSMIQRLWGLFDPDTGQLRKGSVTIEDENTLKLKLSSPNIALIADLSDYPAAVVHPSFDGQDPFSHGIGTGPFRPVEMSVGEKCVLARDTERKWWGQEIFGGPYLDRIEFLDYGTDPSTWLAAAETGEIDLLYESVGDFIDVLDVLGWTRTQTDSAATMVIRTNQNAEVGDKTPYIDTAVRRALALAVDNEICLELGYAGRGLVAANDHVAPVHPGFAELNPSLYDPAQARADMKDAGLMEFEHELVTLDDEWQRNTGDAVAAQLQDNGIKVRRSIRNGTDYWPNWKDFPFSATQWNHRPLGVQVLSLAYRSNSVWNETGFASERFDALLDQAMGLLDADKRREVMGELQTILRDEGVIIQPYWRTLYNHHNGAIVGAERHPSNEIHLYKIGYAA